MDTAPDQARSLHEVFASLAADPAGDPGAALAAAGHGELPADLLNEAVVSYAEVSPPEVAEHLSPVVLGASEDPGLALDLLSSAPQVSWDDVPDEPVAEAPDAAGDAADDVPDLDFGLGDAPDGPGDLDRLDDLGGLDDLDAPAAAAAPAETSGVRTASRGRPRTAGGRGGRAGTGPRGRELGRRPRLGRHHRRLRRPRTSEGRPRDV